LHAFFTLVGSRDVLFRNTDHDQVRRRKWKT